MPSFYPFPPSYRTAKTNHDPEAKHVQSPSLHVHPLSPPGENDPGKGEGAERLGRASWAGTNIFLFAVPEAKPLNPRNPPRQEA